MAKKKRSDGIGFKPLGAEQIEFVRSMCENHLTVCRSRQFGNGKTYCAIGHACSLLKSGQVNRVIFCRSTAGISKRMGYSPGTRAEKMAESVLFAIGYFKLFLGDAYASHALQIEYRDVSDLGGETFLDSMMILDEASDCTVQDMAMFISRAGHGTRCVILGTDRQCNTGCFSSFFQSLKNVPSVGLIELREILRNGWLGPVLRAIDELL